MAALRWAYRCVLLIPLQLILLCSVAGRRAANYAFEALFYVRSSGKAFQVISLFNYGSFTSAADALLNEVDSLLDGSRLDVGQLESVRAIYFFVQVTEVD